MLSTLSFLQIFWLKSLLCFGSSFGLTFLGIKKYISYVQQKQNLFQPIRSDGPESHVKGKKNTPTMGGIFIVLGTLLSTLIFGNLHNPYTLICLFVFISFAAIGLTDDLMKVIYKNPQGFRGSYKIVIQFLIIGIVFICLSYIDPIHAEKKVVIPIGHGYWIHFNTVIYVLFATFVMVGTSNAVNLTDGLDGLVSVPSIINLLCLIALIAIAANPEIAHKLHATAVENVGEISFFCWSLIGAISAFLCFNLKPAKIFMGDVGSLAIGSVLGLIAIIIKQEFIFFIISILFVVEAVSVILQVGSYKLRKKRIFLMAPLHHHFEKLGWSESKVVKSFWSVSLLAAILGAMILR